MLKKTLIVIAGPTAIGKTELAIKIAKHFQTEIVSADSRQFYKEMAIGTAKPSLTELNAAKHHLIDSHSIKEEFSVGDYETSALEILHQIFEKNDFAVLVGGSGLFIKAVTEGFDKLPKADSSLRDELNEIFKNQGIKPLQDQLQSLDPEYFKEVDLHNPQRIIRALEVCISSGLPFSSFRTGQQSERPFNKIKIGLNIDREILYQRINQRVDRMIEEGLVDEVRKLVPHRALNALNTVGYTEIFDFLDSSISFKQAVDSIKQNTRRFAKRQLTWFRKDPEIRWFEPDQFDEIIEFISQEAH